MRYLLLTSLLAVCAAAATEPTTLPLWPSGQVPLAQGTTDKDTPTITVYLPDQMTTGTGVVVCPGGGYQNLAMDHEGKQIAEFLNKLGVAAFVLKYRLGPKYHHPAELMDAQRAIRTVREKAASTAYSRVASASGAFRRVGI